MELNQAQKAVEKQKLLDELGLGEGYEKIRDEGRDSVLWQLEKDDMVQIRLRREDILPEDIPQYLKDIVVYDLGATMEFPGTVLWHDWDESLPLLPLGDEGQPFTDGSYEEAAMGNVAYLTDMASFWREHGLNFSSVRIDFVSPDGKFAWRGKHLFGDDTDAILDIVGIALQYHRILLHREMPGNIVMIPLAVSYHLWTEKHDGLTAGERLPHFHVIFLWGEDPVTPED
ncbi:MAG: hypothetical protein ACOYKB_05305 [Succiniclasticum sp.]|jgi:hypothetical protein